MTKVSLSRQAQAVDTARRAINGSVTPRPSERALLLAELDAVLVTLRWLQANEEIIRKIKAEQGEAS